MIFSERQYRIARDNVYKGAKRRKSLDAFKSVYSIFVSRVDQYTEKHVPTLNSDAQGQVGIVNAKRIWAENKKFWSENKTPLTQEMIFASTGTKNPKDDPTKYVAAFAGSDIETNPPGTNDAVQKSGKSFTKQIDKLPSAEILADIDAKVKIAHLEETLMNEGLQKFADPQKALLKQIADKRKSLA
ncbi:MAG: transaldolase family protein [Pirellulales bacterium]